MIQTLGINYVPKPAAIAAPAPEPPRRFTMPVTIMSGPDKVAALQKGIAQERAYLDYIKQDPATAKGGLRQQVARHIASLEERLYKLAPHLRLDQQAPAPPPERFEGTKGERQLAALDGRKASLRTSANLVMSNRDVCRG